MAQELSVDQALAELGKFKPVIADHLKRMFKLGIRQNMSVEESFQQALRHNERVLKPFIRR